MNEYNFEIRTESNVNFEIFRKFYNRMLSRNRITGILMGLSPYIFLTGVFFCFLDMIIFKEKSIGFPLLVVVLLMGIFMLFLYVVPPRAAWNLSKNKFSLPYKYIFRKNGFSVGENFYDEESLILYSSLELVYDAEDAFYLSYAKEVYIVDKSKMPHGDSECLSKAFASEIPNKYIKIKR